MTKWLLAALIACPSDDDTTGHTGAPGERFTVLGDADNLPPAALLSLWGSSDSDVFVVGADDGTGPVVLQWDGTAWTRLQTGTTGDIWWVWSDGGDRVWFSGEGGRVLMYTRSTDEWVETVIADPTYKLFGIWGASAADIWTVAGQIDNALDGAIYHYDGVSWTQSALVPRKDAWPSEPTGGAVQKRQAFKVWGAASDDVWVVGTLGLTMHWDGDTWTDIRPEPVNNTTTFTTVNGCGSTNVWQVGGFGNAFVAHWDGLQWIDDTPPPQDIVPFFNGVFCRDDQVVACGGGGAIYWRQDSGWEADPRPKATGRDFHACWIDPAGAAWAVGGDLSNQTEGSIVYGGDQVAPVSGL